MKKIKISIKEAVEYYNENVNTMSMTKVANIFLIDRHTLSKNKDEDFSQYKYKDSEFIYKLDSSEEAAVQEYATSGNLPLAYFRKRYGIEERKMQRLLEIANIKYKRYYKVDFNRSAFTDIANEEDAYWLGFLLADGYNNEERGSVTLKLGAADREHLVKFAKYMGESTEERITTDVGGSNNIVYYIAYHCKEMSDRLATLGVFSNKSGLERFNHELPLELQKHYIRGLIDGDGGFTYAPEKRIKFNFQLVGSYNILSAVRNYIHENIIPLEFEHIYTKGVIYDLTIHRFEAVAAIAEHFYKDATIYLDRKKKITDALAVYKSEKKTGTLSIDWESEVKGESNDLTQPQRIESETEGNIISPRGSDIPHKD